VEGQTEETFVKTVLTDYWQNANIVPEVVIVKTGLTKERKTVKGGTVKYAKIKKEIQNLLKDSTNDLVTTMFDYCDLTPDFPGYIRKPIKNYLEQALEIEYAWKADINHPKFLPYLSLHEFEALLFSDIDKIANYFLPLDQTKLLSLRRIRNSFASPEQINQKDKPASRIRKIFIEYNKEVDGSLIALDISLDVVRQECPHFNSWLVAIETRCNAKKESS
jgi:hypothetical protein